MSDYINREMAADCIVLECDNVTLEQARQAIKDCPSADVVKVVRCKDCKYNEKCTRYLEMLEEKANGYGYYKKYFLDYCSYGENTEAQEESEIINARKGEE